MILYWIVNISGLPNIVDAVLRATYWWLCAGKKSTAWAKFCTKGNMNEGLDPEAWKDSLHAVNDDVDPFHDDFKSKLQPLGLHWDDVEMLILGCHHHK